MLPLVEVAVSILPDLIKLIAGDKAGAIATDVSKAVTDVTGESNKTAAQQKLKADPQAEASLKIKLAQIAVDATKAQDAERDKQKQEEIAALKATLEEQDRKSQDQLAAFKASLAAELKSTAGARQNLLDLVKTQSPLAWAPAVMSFIVTIGFFGILAAFLFEDPSKHNQLANNNLINISVGALVAAFTATVHFWMGSSQSSRFKDVASLQLQTNQAAQNSELAKAQTAHTDAALNSLTTIAKAGRTAGSAQEPTTDKTDNFEQCLAVTLEQEGGYTENSDDSGGATNFGITIGTLKRWRGTDVTKQDVKELSKNEAREIYRTDYWNPMRCSELPRGVDLIVFDFGVTSGPRTSVKLLQKAIGVADDGSVGPITVQAVKGVDATELVSTLSDQRLDYYRTLKDFSVFGQGWAKRTREVEKAARSMCA